MYESLPWWLQRPELHWFEAGGQELPVWIFPHGCSGHSLLLPQTGNTELRQKLDWDLNQCLSVQSQHLRGGLS